MEQYKTKTIVALVLGIASLVIAWFGWGALIGLGCGIAGLVLALQVRKGYDQAGVKPDGMTTAAFICSLVGLILSAIVLIVVIAAASCIGCAACSYGGAACSLGSLGQYYY